MSRTQSGTFQEGDLRIGKAGLIIGDSHQQARGGTPGCVSLNCSSVNLHLPGSACARSSQSRQPHDVYDEARKLAGNTCLLTARRSHDGAVVSPGHAGLFGTALPDMAEVHPPAWPPHTCCSQHLHNTYLQAGWLVPHMAIRTAYLHSGPAARYAMVVSGVPWRHQVGEEPEDEEEQQLRALQLEDLEDHGTVGAGTSGVVNKVVHLPTGRTLALKVRRRAPAIPSGTLASTDLTVRGHAAAWIQQNLCVCVHQFTTRTCGLQVMQFDVSNDTVRKQITAELRTLYDSHHAFIVRYYQVSWIAVLCCVHIRLHPAYVKPQHVLDKGCG
jgi:hypothetical protein